MEKKLKGKPDVWAGMTGRIAHITTPKSRQDIIRNYAIYANDSDALEYYLSSVKSKTIKSLKEYKSVTDNKIILSKIGAVIKNIEGLQTESVDDKTISKYLTLVSLKNEIMRKEK